MATVRDHIKGALRLIGAIATGETPNAEEQADGLYALNDMLDSWSTENLVIPAKVRETFSLVGGTSSYTFGTGGTFASTRPVKIEAAAVLVDGFEHPLELVTPEQWAKIRLKSTESTIPTHLYAQGTAPLETLELYPVPSAAATLVVYSWKPLTRFTSASTEVEFPPGYAKAIRYNLALELAPEYAKAPDAVIVSQAAEAKENIKRRNIKPHYLACDPVLSGKPFNILTGE